MKKRFFYKLCFILIILLLSACSATLESFKKEGTDFNKYNRISVIQFYSPENPSYGQEIADVMAFQFMKKGYDVIERSQLKAVVDEEALRMSGLSESNREALKIRGITGIVTGSVSRYECIPSLISVSNVSLNTNKCSVSLAFKMLDVQSGEVVWAANGSHSDEGINLTAHQILLTIAEKINTQIPSRAALALQQQEQLSAQSVQQTQLNLQPVQQVAAVQPVQQSAPEEKFITQGNAFYSQGRYVDAITQYQQAIKINPDNAQVLNNLGVSYYQSGLTEYAIKYYREAIKIDPNFSSAHDNLAIALHKQGKFAEALPEYKKACELGITSTCDWLKQNNL